MAVQSVTGTLAQDGYWDGTVWTEASTWVQLAENLGQVAGFRWTGFPTASTYRSEFLSVGATITFRIADVSPPQIPIVYDLYVRKQRAPAAYSTSNPPPYVAGLGPLSDIHLGTVTVTTTGAQDLVFTPDTARLDTARHAGGPLLQAFNGAFAFHLHARTANGSLTYIEEQETGTAATFVYQLDTRVFTGIETPGRLAASRPDICPVCGGESLRETWTWCEYHNRLECPGCADPDWDELGRTPPSGNDLVGED